MNFPISSFLPSKLRNTLQRGQFPIKFKFRNSNFKLGRLWALKSGLKRLPVILFLVFVTCYLSLVTVFAEPDCDNPDFGSLDFCIQKIQNEIDQLAPAQEYNKKELESLRSQLKSLDTKIAGLSKQLVELEKNIKQREEELAYTKEIFEEKTNNHYKFLRTYDPVLPYLSASGASEIFREINFRQKTAEENSEAIEEYAQSLVLLNNDKAALEKNKESLAKAKSQVSSREDFLADEVETAETYLATLSSKQEDLKALKAGGFQTSIGDTPATLDPCSGPPGSSNYCDPGFRPAFGAFSFGAPHRTGMSQYGAYGRSKQGQSAETILSAYYQGADLNKGYSVPASITVDGYGSIPFEENYLLGIYEVPESWGENGGFEALKAQAVAARSYALYRTNNGAASICPSESCQVYKPQLKSGKWAEAVRATRGWVLTKGGSPAASYYASTSGGFTISQWGWSGIKDAAGAWPDTAYEKIAGSPWFYKAWYKTRSGATCGQTNPWLKSEQIADIVNAWYALHNGGDTSRITPQGSCWGGNPYSQSELASIGGYTSVSSVSVVYANSGSTQSVRFDTNKGSVTIDGNEFKDAFNLRAPGYIGIKSSLFNIEKI